MSYIRSQGALDDASVFLPKRPLLRPNNNASIFPSAIRGLSLVLPAILGRYQIHRGLVVSIRRVFTRINSPRRSIGWSRSIGLALDEASVLLPKRNS